MASEAKTPTIAPMTRREFLYYIWGASMALAMAQVGGATLWFVIPRFKAGEFGGIFEIEIGKLPPPDSDPVPYDEGRFWLVNMGEAHANDPRLQEYLGGEPYAVQKPGVKALYKICVHLGCIYKWVPTNNRFECPCHGSKYLPSGMRVGGPARRNLDVFIVEAVDAGGNVITQTEATLNGTDGSAIDITGAAKIRVNTGRRISGAPNAVPGVG
jgi:cytochrome b6-f complex iron-sulfur subunit